jgi:glycerol-3-phosphate acyltransferase PlsY
MTAFDAIEPVNWGRALGCLTTGYYLVRLRLGQDLREIGSGTVGARNVGRILGWPGFVLTVLGDLGKGALAVWGAEQFTTDSRLVALAMLCVVAGHVWPAQLRFHGGKGVATSLGALLVYDYHLAGAFVLAFVVAYAFIRRTVLPGLFAFVCLPMVSYYLERSPGKAFFLSLLAGIVLLEHRKNVVEEFAQWLDRRPAPAKSNPHDV